LLLSLEKTYNKAIIALDRNSVINDNAFFETIIIIFKFGVFL